MKLLIASDIHGAAGYCRQLLDAWDREGADRLLLLGDVLYHGPRNDLPPLQAGDILLHGHTHVPAWQAFGNDNYYLNPGSISIPKENSAHGYMTLKDGVFTWKTLDGEKYHEVKV